MRTLILVSAALVVLVASSVFATETRVITLGNTNNVLLDEENIWIFPSRVFDYPRLAVGEVGQDPANNNFTRLGIHWEFGKKKPFVLGTYFSELPAVVPDDLNGGALYNADSTRLDNRRIDLFYARQLGNYNGGLRFSYIHSGTELDNPDNAFKECFSYYDFDLGVTPVSGKWDLALNFGLGTFADENEDGEDETAPDGYYDFSLMGRYFYPMAPDYVFVPHFSFMSSKRGAEHYALEDADNPDPDLDMTEDNSRTTIVFGCGLNYEPSQSVFAVADLGFRYSKYSQELQTSGSTSETDISDTWFPYFRLGLDAQVFSWLDVRLGASSNWASTTSEFNDGNNTTKHTRSFADNDTYLGMGFHFGNFHIDTYTDPDLLLRGFDFISDSDNYTSDMNFQVGLVYEM
ncbi:hypothetical protein GF356_00130 [candidate division GN15 bacterium]|nr:hypothetical protein [candidate division GN15 bacterium]